MLGNHALVNSVSPFEGGFFRVVVDTIRLPNGDEAVREYVLHPGAAAVVVVCDGAVLLVRQNRHAVGNDLLEIPAGKLDVEGETPEECAHRELEEETGYRAGALEPLGVFYSSPGFTNERFHLFVATDVVQAAPAPQTDGGEPISIEWLPLDEAVAAVVSGRIRDGKTALGLVLARLRGAG
ncbi:MAG: NUDIX hydrolase [Actinomycetota bacterium]